VHPSTSEGPCPYCAQSIAPLPKRKRKCPHCGKTLWVRLEIALTEEQARQYDQLFNFMSPLVSAAEAFQQGRERAAEELRQAKQLAGFAVAMRIIATDDHTTCAFCRAQNGKVIPVNRCTVDMLPPFKQCAHEQGRKAATDQGCRCFFTTVPKGAPS
jgi:hypothetical protein